MKTTAKLAIGAKILAAKLKGEVRPFFVQYVLLYGCDARCDYCNSPHRPATQLSTAEHKEILRQFARLGTVRVKFHGGEPLLRKDLGELLAEVKRLGMRAAVVTNGLMLPERLDAVRRADELVISLDGDEVTHDRHRGAGTWRRVMRAIDLCKQEGIEFFLNAVVTRHSAGDIDWLLATAARLGVMVNFQLLQTNEVAFGAHTTELMPAPEEIRAILAKILAAKEAGAPVLFSAHSYRHTLNWPDFSLERLVRPAEVSPCTAGRYFLNVEPNGDLIPCALHGATFTAKNALRDGVEAAWRHAQQHSCFDCYNTWLHESRAVFALRPAVLGNFWRNYLNPTRRRNGWEPSPCSGEKQHA
ncbi:MAG: radical SAM protein [Candidatus Tectomicrobia bacterium]|nr:radical SAM protein [Candidatus Tectomicrobia bacterium]